MYVFLTAWRLTPQQRRQLLDATRGATRIWCYAPGYQDDHGTSLEAMQELTGFYRIKKVTPAKALATPTPAGARLGLKEPLGVDARIEPLLAVVDAAVQETLATYPDGSTAVAMRRSADGVSLFVGPPGLTPQLLRLAARQAGVHLFAQQDCNVYANGPYVALHASQDGPLELDAGQAGALRDLLTGQALGQGPKISLTLKKGETRVLVVEPPR